MTGSIDYIKHLDAKETPHLAEPVGEYGVPNVGHDALLFLLAVAGLQ